MKNLLIITFFLLALFAINSKAQGLFKFTCSEMKPFSEKDFKDWLGKDVGYIISKAEKEAFLKLKTDEDRNTFIEKFWLRRDPDPDTEENEFRDEYCERANQTSQFDAGIPGWRTNRGFIYILYGKPDRIEKGYGHFEGLENIMFERWFFRHIDGLGSDIDFTFFDPMGTDEFRLPKGKREEIMKKNEAG